MLQTLELRDFAIVDELTLELSDGLNVLTGETGAGKSIVVDALELLSGGRPDATSIRAGATSALVQATFTDAPFGSASRRLAANGRHGARLDGELVTVGELTAAAAAQVRVFGQHAAQQLLSHASQREQLDRLLSAPGRAALARHEELFVARQAAVAALEELRAAERERSRRLDTLVNQIREIDRVKPHANEDEALNQELRSLQNAERILAAGSAALGAITGDDGRGGSEAAGEAAGAVIAAAAALKELESVARHVPLFGQLASELREHVSGLSAVAAEVEGFLSGFDADPARLDAVQGRLAALEELGRKYGPTIADVISYRSAAAAERESLEGTDEEIARLEAQAAELEIELKELATTITHARREAGRALTAGVLPLLATLGLDKARFEVSVTPAARASRHGQDEVAFLFGANPGEPLLRVADVASGGELSRIMLALHVVTGSDLPTVAFDEVDAGIGGKTATHVGALLARLARDRQVLVVTHLAQVAAYATAHFKVEKVVQEGRTVTRVRRLLEAERSEELARLLSGTLTEASLRHAAELLAAAGNAVAEHAVPEPTTPTGAAEGRRLR